MEQEERTKRENIVGGIVGAFLGSLVGVLCTVVIGQLGYVASVSGLVMAVGALKGYELLGGSLSKKGAVISSVLVLVMTWFAHRLSWSIAVASSVGVNVFQCFRLIPTLLEDGWLESRAYWGDLAMLYLFTLLGAVPTILAGLRNASLPDYPAAAAPAAQNGAPATIFFYPGQASWMRPLRLSAALSMFAGLVPTIVLIIVGGINESYSVFFLAAVGCLISTFVIMGFALSNIRLCNNAMLLLVRVNGTVWKVTLPMLNNADTYRFTKKTGALRAIRWDILNGEEQERAKTSVMRAITLLSSGQVMPGSLLGMAVLPLNGLRVVKETKWGWICAYTIANGREKKISIPKAYPGFAPDFGMEPAQAPVPARWGLAGLSLALAAVLGLVGAGIGYQIDNPGSASRDPEPTPTPTQTQTAPPVETFDPQEWFHVGEELGYTYTAVGYIQAPAGMFGPDSSIVDAHVPYSTAPEYLDNGSGIRSSAHGMEVTVTIAWPYETAQAVVDEAYAMLEEAGTDIYEASDTQYIEEYDIAVKQVTYFEDNMTKVRVVILYADYKQDGYYLSAAITYLPEQMDEEYPELLAELSDAYALNLPEIPPMDEL